MLSIIWDYIIKIYATIIKLIDKWTTSIEIIDYANVSYDLTYHIFGIFENFPTSGGLQGNTKGKKTFKMCFTFLEKQKIHFSLLVTRLAKN